MLLPLKVAVLSLATIGYLAPRELDVKVRLKSTSTSSFLSLEALAAGSA